MRSLWRIDLPKVLRGFVISGFVLVASSGIVSAHEVGGSRFDAPIPLPFLFAGAGVTVAATAGWLAVSTNAASTRMHRRKLTTVSQPLGESLALVSRIAFFFLFVLTLALGLLGPQVAAENFATVFVWPIWLKGLLLLSALVGSPWRVLSPWRTLYHGLVRLEGDELAIVGTYPSWLREWPALVGFVVWIGILENLTTIPSSPRATTLVVAGYTTIMILGAIAFGDEWLAHADSLAVLYRLIGRVAPLRVGRGESGGYEVVLRPPWDGCTRSVGDITLVAFVVATVYTVSFDGFTSTPEYQSILFSTRDAIGLGPITGILLYVAGYLVFLGSFAVVGAIADVAGGRMSRGRSLMDFAPTVLPIAVAYEISHNYPSVARNLGQLSFVLGKYVVADPSAVELLFWLSLPVFWGSQVLLVVAGHIVAVVAAHYVTLDRYPARQLATRAHVPLTVLMVGYTVISLWIVSRPVMS